MDPRTGFGRDGEQLVADHYRRQGFTILERNYRCRLGELDLVAARGPLLVFCEVKSRHSARWGEPSEAVGPRKQQRLRRLAASWMAERRPRAAEIRFDVASVVVGDRGPDLTLIPDAF